MFWLSFLLPDSMVYTDWSTPKLSILAVYLKMEIRNIPVGSSVKAKVRTKPHAMTLCLDKLSG